MKNSVVLVERKEPAITILTLNRPEKRNALNIALLQQLHQSIEETEKLPDQRAIILTGAGSIFCAGLDFHEATRPEDVETVSHLIAKLISKLTTSRLFTLAAIQGSAIAGGAALASSCDFVIADRNTQIGFPEVHRGLVPALVASILVRRLRGSDVRELLLLGELISMDRAHAIGLVNRVVDGKEVLPQALVIAEKVQDGSPRAIAETKRLLNLLAQKTIDENLEIGLQFHREARRSEDARIGIAAFLEKRKPNWGKQVK